MKPEPAAITVAPTLALVFAMTAAAQEDATHIAARSEYRAPLAAVAPRIDGVADDAAWQAAPWREIGYRWLGPEYNAQDFSGRFKVVWTASRLYILTEVVDDVLIDTHRDPLVHYWDDDCLEIFLDEDYSGGDHQYNHNAFAYHLALDNQAVDIGTDREPKNFSHHVESRWMQRGDRVVWEIALDVYPDDYDEGAGKNTAVQLAPGKVLGLMVAWCDNDGSEFRENFIGSEFIPPEHRDRGWIDAGLFGKLLLEGKD